SAHLVQLIGAAGPLQVLLGGADAAQQSAGLGAGLEGLRVDDRRRARLGALEDAALGVLDPHLAVAFDEARALQVGLVGRAFRDDDQGGVLGRGDLFQGSGAALDLIGV